MQRSVFGMLVVALACALLFSVWPRYRVPEVEVARASGSHIAETSGRHIAAKGTIYYRCISEPGRLWCVQADGSARRALPDGISGEPSRELHDGQRWFLAVLPSEDSTGGEGLSRCELCLITERGARITLCDQPDLQPSAACVRWLGSDRAVAWMARRINEKGGVIEGGLYEAQVAMDAGGSPTGLVAQPKAPRVRFNLVPGDWDEAPAGLVPDLCRFDYSPDGLAIVYESVNQRLYVYDLERGQARLLSESAGFDPVWSSDGSLILFRVGGFLGAIAGIRPDGSKQVELVETRTGEWVVTHPISGPEAGYFLYARTERQSAVDLRVNLLVRRMGGSDERVAALDLPLWAAPIAWR